MEELAGELCPFCHEKKLTLMEDRREIPFFGPVHIYSMSCEGCRFHKADVEAEGKGDPVKYTFQVEGEEDMKVRVVKSSEAVVKIPRVVTISPGPASNGYVTNIEGILRRVMHHIESSASDEEEPDAQKQAKKLMKRLNRVIGGQEKLTIMIEDPSGNSAIVSERAKVGKP